MHMSIFLFAPNDFVQWMCQMFVLKFFMREKVRAWCFAKDFIVFSALLCNVDAFRAQFDFGMIGILFRKRVHVFANVKHVATAITVGSIERAHWDAIQKKENYETLKHFFKCSHTQRTFILWCHKKVPRPCLTHMVHIANPKRRTIVVIIARAPMNPIRPTRRHRLGWWPIGCWQNRRGSPSRTTRNSCVKCGPTIRRFCGCVIIWDSLKRIRVWVGWRAMLA